MLNVKPLWLVCGSMLLSFDGDGSSSELFRLIHLGLHSLAAQVISHLSSPKSQNLGGPSQISFSLEQLPSSITPLVVASFVAFSNLLQLLL